MLKHLCDLKFYTNKKSIKEMKTFVTKILQEVLRKSGQTGFIELVGSSKQNMIVVSNDDKNIDLDYNLVINKKQDNIDFLAILSKIKRLLLEQFKIYNIEHFWQRTQVITFDITNCVLKHLHKTIENVKVDLAIMFFNTKTKHVQKVIFDKVNQEYTLTDFGNLCRDPGKVCHIKRVNKWHLVRDEYLNLKCIHRNMKKTSYELLNIAIGNVYDEITKE